MRVFPTRLPKSKFYPQKPFQTVPILISGKGEQGPSFKASLLQTGSYSKIQPCFTHVCISSTGKWMAHDACSLGAPLMNEWPLGLGCSSDICTFVLIVPNKASAFQKLRTISIYYLTVSVSEQSEHKSTKALLLQGFHKAIIKVSVGPQSHLRFKEGKSASRSTGCWQTSFPCGCQTERPASYWLPAKDSPSFPPHGPLHRQSHQALEGSPLFKPAGSLSLQPTKTESHIT